MTPELHRPLLIERVGAAGYTATLDATDKECAALARRMGIPSVASLHCRFHLRRQQETIVTAEGYLVAKVTQTCVVSLDDFESTVEESFRVRFVPADEVDEEPDPDADDELPYEGAVIDLGEAAAEQLGLALDPYPRKPDAELPVVAEETEEHPFATLARLQARSKE